MASTCFIGRFCARSRESKILPTHRKRMPKGHQSRGTLCKNRSRLDPARHFETRSSICRKSSDREHQSLLGREFEKCDQVFQQGRKEAFPKYVARSSTQCVVHFSNKKSLLSFNGLHHFLTIQPWFIILPSYRQRRRILPEHTHGKRLAFHITSLS